MLLGLAGLKPVFPVSAAAIILLGLYLGYAYFAAVYYASKSGRWSLNIGVNECLLGMGSFAGLFAAQWGEMLIGKDGGMYAMCGIALLVSLLIQIAVVSLPPPPPVVTVAPEPALLGLPVRQVVVRGLRPGSRP
jgi:hypothetical protein